MYGYEWTGQNGIYRLSVNSKIEKEIRPVFKEELDYFGFNEHWTYPDTDAPLLWAEGIRRYILNGSFPCFLMRLRRLKSSWRTTSM